MLTLRVSMAPVPIAVGLEIESAHRPVDSAGPRRKAPKRSQLPVVLIIGIL